MSSEADATGDGVSELLLRNDPEKLRLHMVRRAKDELTVIERPLFETTVDRGAEIRVEPGVGRSPPEILVLDDTSLLHVRFGR